LEDKREDYRNCFSAVLCTAIVLSYLHTRMGTIVHTDEVRSVGLGLVFFVIVFSCEIFVSCLVVSTSAVDCLERLVSEVNHCLSSWTLNSTHSLTVGRDESNIQCCSPLPCHEDPRGPIYKSMSLTTSPCLEDPRGPIYKSLSRTTSPCPCLGPQVLVLEPQLLVLIHRQHDW